MIRNMGSFDRGVRAFVVAPLVVVLAFVVGAGTVAGVILFVVAGTMLATSAIRFCPNYVWLGITTYPRGVRRVAIITFATARRTCPRATEAERRDRR